MSGRTVLWGIALALLAGCAVGPSYKPPDDRVPAKWATHLAAGESGAPAALAYWWTSFKDPELNTLIGTAIRSNLTLRVAEEVEASSAEVGAAEYARRDVLVSGETPHASQHRARQCSPLNQLCSSLIVAVRIMSTSCRTWITQE